MSEEFNPSRCEIIKAIITSHDDSQRLDVSGNFIGKFKLSQSMTSVAYKGSAFCLDTQGILESFPLRGEEKLELHIKAFDLGTTIKLKTRIYKISDMAPAPNSNSISYTDDPMCHVLWCSTKRKHH